MLAMYISIVAAIILLVLIYIGPSNVPFGVQIATAIMYTGAMFLFVFCRTKANTEYN
jgi:O-antigen/teichoic acid export membrane protein